MSRLEQIEARLTAATLLPWMKDPDDPDKVLHSTNGGFDGTLIATVQRDDYGLFEEANTDLIAHAPDDIAALLAVVKAVRAIHRPTTAVDHPDEPYCCFEDAEDWPCPTMRAINDNLEGS